MSVPSSLFSFMYGDNPELVSIGQYIEDHLFTNPHEVLAKSRIYTEHLVNMVIAYEELRGFSKLNQFRRVQKLYQDGFIKELEYQKFEWIRKMGNQAAHQSNVGDVQDAILSHRYLYDLSVWYQETYSEIPFEAPAYYLPQIDIYQKIGQAMEQTIAQKFQMLQEEIAKLKDLAIQNTTYSQSELQGIEAKDLNVTDQDVAQTIQEVVHRKNVRYEFYQKLLELAKEKNLTLFEQVNPTKETFLQASSGVSGLNFHFHVYVEQKTQIKLVMERSNRDENKRLFELLLLNKQQVEQKFGLTLEWSKKEKIKKSEIVYTFQLGGIYEKQKWPEIQEAMVDGMIALQQAFKAYIDAIKNAPVLYKSI